MTPSWCVPAAVRYRQMHEARLAELYRGIDRSGATWLRIEPATAMEPLQKTHVRELAAAELIVPLLIAVAQ